MLMLDVTNQVDRAQDDTNRLISDTRDRLQKLASATKSSSGSEARVRKAKQSEIAKSFMKVVESYQSMQSNSRKEYRKRVERELKIAKPDATPQEIERALDSRSGGVFAQQMLSGASNQRILAQVKGRHEEILKLEESINDLVNLFQEMQLLIDVFFSNSNSSLNKSLSLQLTLISNLQQWIFKKHQEKYLKPLITGRNLERNGDGSVYYS